MPFKVVEEPGIARASEDCCFCHVGTKFWYFHLKPRPFRIGPTCVPCCQDCAKIYNVKDLPTRAAWEAERDQKRKEHRQRQLAWDKSRAEQLRLRNSAEKTTMLLVFLRGLLHPAKDYKFDVGKQTITFIWNETGAPTIAVHPGNMLTVIRDDVYKNGPHCWDFELTRAYRYDEPIQLAF